MGISSDSLSWVKRVRQKIESSCNDYVYACNQYANTASGHIKKICDEIYEEKKKKLYDEANERKNKLYDVSEVSPVEPDRDLSDCDRIQPLASGIIQSSSACQAHGIECGEDYDETIKTEAANYSQSKEQDRKEISNIRSLPAHVVRSYKDERVQLDFDRDGEIYDGRYHTAPGSPAYVQNIKSLTKGMEDIMINDLDDDDVENEITLIAQRAAAKKNTSLTRKVKNLFISKKGYYIGAQSDICREMQNRDAISSSAIVDCGDSLSKWELLELNGNSSLLDGLTGKE